MRDDILTVIGDEKNVTDVIILTHNIDYIFIQTVVLKSLKKCGSPSLTIFADASCALESFENQKLVISGLGQRYRVVPIHLNGSHDRFHPKAVLLSGENKASLFVGSGNLTFGGWRQNAEVWNQYDTDEDGTGVFHAFKNYLYGTIKRLPSVLNIEKAIVDAYDTKTKVWTHTLEEPSKLVGRINTEKSLLEQMKDYAESGCQKLIIQSPYFDKEGKTIQYLNDQFNPQKIDIMAQSKYSELTEEIIKKLPSNAEVISTNFVHNTTKGSKRAFIHAKFYAFQYSDRVIVFSGSANCSLAALSFEGTTLGNAELMNVEEMDLEMFEQNFMSEFEIVDVPYEPMSVIEAEEDSTQDDTHLRVKILSAQYELNRLRIVYSVFKDYEVIGCKVGDERHIASSVEKNLLIIDNITLDQGDYLCLLVKNIQTDDVFCTKEIWIDHEKDLTTSVKTRSLNDFLENNSGQTLDYEKFGDLIKIFNEHLSYTPERVEQQALNEKAKTNTKRVTFDIKDVFVNSYKFKPQAHILSNKYNLGLYTLLREYLGLKKAHDDDEAITLTQEELEQQLEEDTLEIEDEKSESLKQTKLNENDKKKLKKLLGTLIEAFINPDIIENRPLKMLLDDLKVASIILRVGLKEHWISQEEYFDATYILWTELFFSSNVNDDYGYIDIKLNNENINIEDFLSPDLSATMLAWLYAVEPSNTLMYIRLVLSAILVQAKYNWIFMSSNNIEDINEELNKTLATIEGKENIQKTIKEQENLWKLILKTADAFYELTKKLDQYKPGDFSEVIPEVNVQKGELLWQGNKKGFYIVKSNYKRVKKRKNSIQSIEVISINSKKKNKNFSVELTIPVKTLFKVMPDLISEGSQNHIIDFIETYLFNISDIDDETM